MKKTNKEHKIINIPDKIYLNLGFDTDELIRDEDFEKLNKSDAITWCQDKINDADIEYRLAQSQLKKTKQEIEAQTKPFFTRGKVEFTPFLNRERVKEIVEGWEQYKAGNWSDSDVIDMGKMLMDKYINLICNDLCEPKNNPQLKMTDEEIQELTGDYDIHATFQYKDGKKYKLIPVEEEQSQPEITDEEIKEASLECYEETYRFFKGAVWYRDELRKRNTPDNMIVRLIKELIKNK